MQSSSSCPCWLTCGGADYQEKWLYLRTSVLSVVDTPAFEWFVLVLIFASSITLCFEDIYLDTNLGLKQFLYWTNFVFSMVFVVEMVLKWMALGFTRYFTSFWTILDFIIVFVRIHRLVLAFFYFVGFEDSKRKQGFVIHKEYCVHHHTLFLGGVFILL